jgi:D-alanyl-D-alanine carboxypeptidase
VKRLLTILAVLLLVAAAALAVWRLPKTSDLKNEQSETSSRTSKNGFDKKKYSLTDPGSLWVVVNKKRPLPGGFVPKNLVDTGNGEQLRHDASQSLDNLLTRAGSKGLNLYVISGYRSYGYQADVYSGHVNADGQEAADRYSARPGHSEHQTGLGVDLGSGVCDLQACFGQTPEGKWLANNADKYGFVIRYLKGKEPVVGYQYEPWHLRYVGKGLASQLHGSNQTMEEFFGLPAAPNY